MFLSKFKKFFKKSIDAEEKFDNQSDDDYEYLLEMLKERRKKERKRF